MSEINPDSKESELAQELFSEGMSLAAKYLIALGIAEVPFLGLPIIKQIFTFIVNRIIGKASNEGELMISFKFIDNDKDERNGQYKEALKEWRQVATNSTISQEEKNAKLEEARKRMGDLIRFPRR
jgi:hypothetical protein